MSKIISLLEPISKIFSWILYAVTHPVETITGLIDIIIAFIPAVCIVIFLFYLVTGSRKILGVMSMCILAFVLLKAAIVFNVVWLVVVVVVAILLIRYLGVVA